MWYYLRNNTHLFILFLHKFAYIYDILHIFVHTVSSFHLDFYNVQKSSDSSTLFHASIFNLGLWLNISGQDAGKFSILLNFLIPNLTAVRLENPKSDRCQSWANMHPTCCLEFWRVYTHTHTYIYIHTYTCVCVCVCGMCVHIPEVGSLHHLRSPELDAVP